MANTYSASCIKCTAIFTAKTAEAAEKMRDAHERGCKSDIIDDYDPTGR